MVVDDAHVFPGFLTPVLRQLFFRSHRLLFSHASAEVRGKNMPERKFTSTGDQTHNHQVMSPIRSPLSYPCGATEKEHEVRDFSFLAICNSSKVYFKSLPHNPDLKRP